MSTTAGIASRVQGQVISPGDAGYDEARALWNGMIDRKPAAIVRAAGVADVVAAVNFAREQNLPLAVRGGGHNAAGNALADDGLVIDLSGMRGVKVDPAARIARVQGGATWGDFDGAAGPHGLATTGGLISTTGVGGLTLGGGLGWLMRTHGMACDNVRSVEIVTADGQVRRASASENPDLYWAVRGGGGNFGVVTEFEFQLHPVSTVLAGMVVHPVARAREVMRFVRDFNKTAPDEISTFIGLMTTPDGMQVCAVFMGYFGDQSKAEAALRPLREFGPPVADMVQPMPYQGLQSMLDEGFPKGIPVYWRADFIKTLGDDVIDVLIDRFSQVKSPLSALLLEAFGGAVSRVPRDANAFVQRNADYNLAIISRWLEPGQADENIAWARETHAAIRPYAAGTYVNYLGEEGADRVRAAYGDDVYDRLVAVKNDYDPTNLFRFNQNIRPTV